MIKQALPPTTNLRTSQLDKINEIAGSLNSGECRTAFYLFGLDTNNVSDMKEMLKAHLRDHTDDRCLVELLFVLQRFDIMRNMFGTNRDTVERNMDNFPRHRVLMCHLNENITKEDLKNIKFLFSNTLSREKMEDSKHFLDIVVELEKLDKISYGRLDIMEECLRNIGRVDLANKIRYFQRSTGTSPQESVVPQTIQKQMLRAPTSYPIHRFCPSVQQRKHEQLQCIAPATLAVPVQQSKLCESSLEEYKLQADPRGVCVIIDCVGNDGDMMEHTFMSLHFKVVKHKWLGVADALSVLRGIFRERENQQSEAFICCIISRGTPTDLLATDSCNTGLRLDSLRRLFNADTCPWMTGKPKLFFIQRYSVSKQQACCSAAYGDGCLETDGLGGLTECVPTDADVFWSHCCTDEHQLEQRDHRSVYLQALADTLQKSQNRKRHLVDIHTRVNDSINNHNKKNPGTGYNIDLKHTLRKNLFFP